MRWTLFLLLCCCAPASSPPDAAVDWPYSFDPSAYAMTRRMLHGMSSIGHRTAWVSGGGEQDGEEFRYFLLFTVDTKQAKRVQEVLQREGLLCNRSMDDLFPEDSRP